MSERFFDRDLHPITPEQWLTLLEEDGYALIQSDDVADSVAICTIWTGLNPDPFETAVWFRPDEPGGAPHLLVRHVHASARQARSEHRELLRAARAWACHHDLSQPRAWESLRNELVGDAA